MVNKNFITCVKHFKGAALLDTLSMNVCVVSCMKDRPTTSDNKDKNGMNCCMSALVQEKGWKLKSNNPKHTRKQHPKKGEKPEGDLEREDEFQLLFVKDIKEHLDNFDFESRCKTFCEESNKLTDG